MRTDELITGLARSPQPTVRPPLRIAAAMIGGWIAALAVLMIVLGPPLTAVSETGATPFALKLGFTLALSALAAQAALAAGRPGQPLLLRLSLIALPYLVIAVAAGFELSSATEWKPLLFGSTFITCLGAISLASVPVMIAMFWAYRALAPTRPALAGLVAGLSSGAAAAVAYALYCPETTASFLMASYTPAMLVPAIVGMLLGSRLMRW